MNVQKGESGVLRWSVGIPILTNRFIMTQVAAALGIPALLIGGIIFIFTLTDDSIPREPSNDWMYVIFLLAMVFGLAALLILIIYKNRFWSIFEVDEKRIRQYPMKRTAKKNTAVNSILFFAGLAAGKPGYAGTALIAQSTQSASISWRNVGRLKFYPRQRAIGVKNSWRTVLVVYCTPENYDEVSQFMHHRFNSINKSHKG